MKLTLKMIRETNGYTLEEVAKHCEVPVNVMEGYEKDAGEMPAKIMMMLHDLYKISLDLIQF